MIKEIKNCGKDFVSDLDKLGCWNIPKDFKKRLSSGEMLEIWRITPKIKKEKNDKNKIV